MDIFADIIILIAFIIMGVVAIALAIISAEIAFAVGAVVWIFAILGKLLGLVYVGSWLYTIFLPFSWAIEAALWAWTLIF